MVTARAMLTAIHQLIDTNYDVAGQEALVTWEETFTSEDIERRFTGFEDTEVFAAMVAEGRSLLSDDRVDFLRLANMNREFAESAEARPNIELPRLRGFAAEIQALVEQEYRQ